MDVGHTGTQPAVALGLWLLSLQNYFGQEGRCGTKDKMVASLKMAALSQATVTRERPMNCHLATC